METESYLGQTGDLKKKIAELLQENERLKEENIKYFFNWDEHNKEVNELTAENEKLKELMGVEHCPSIKDCYKVSQEMEQQAKRIAELEQAVKDQKKLNKELYESNERQAVVIAEFKQEGTAERARANNAVGKYWEAIERNKQLEELLKEHKLILEILQPWTSGIGWIQHEGHFFNMTDRIKAALNK